LVRKQKTLIFFNLPRQPVEQKSLSLAHRTDIEEELNLAQIARQGLADRPGNAEQQEQAQAEEYPILHRVEDDGRADYHEKNGDDPVDQLGQADAETAVQPAESRHVTLHGAMGQPRQEQDADHYQKGHGEIEPALLDEGLEVALRRLRDGHLLRHQLVELQLGCVQLALHEGLLFVPAPKRRLKRGAHGLVRCLAQQPVHVLDGLADHGESFLVVGDLLLQVGFLPHVGRHLLHLIQRRLEQGEELLLEVELIGLLGVQAGDIDAGCNILDVQVDGPAVGLQLFELRGQALLLGVGLGRPNLPGQCPDIVRDRLAQAHEGRQRIQRATARGRRRGLAWGGERLLANLGFGLGEQGDGQQHEPQPAQPPGESIPSCH
jgi:hypothetical protein